MRKTANLKEKRVKIAFELLEYYQIIVPMVRGPYMWLIIYFRTNQALYNEMRVQYILTFNRKNSL